jgi:uncharacterized protein YndB with AHSA1/START domain
MDDEVTREMEMPAPPDEVWRWLTDPELLALWLGARDAEVDLRPGGDLLVRDDSGAERTGWVEEADEARRLAFWWRLPDEDATRVELELEESEEGTLLRVVESRPLATIELQATELSGEGGAQTGPMMLAGV